MFLPLHVPRGSQSFNEARHRGIESRVGDNLAMPMRYTLAASAVAVSPAVVVVSAAVVVVSPAVVVVDPPQPATRNIRMTKARMATATGLNFKCMLFLSPRLRPMSAIVSRCPKRLQVGAPPKRVNMLYSARRPPNGLWRKPCPYTRSWVPHARHSLLRHHHFPMEGRRGLRTAPVSVLVHHRPEGREPDSALRPGEQDLGTRGRTGFAGVPLSTAEHCNPGTPRLRFSHDRGLPAGGHGLSP